MSELRQKLFEAALEWERNFGNTPSITTVLSEFDAACLVGCNSEIYSKSMQDVTSVQKGFDFKFNGLRYQRQG